MLMYHATVFLVKNNYQPGEKSDREIAWWQDNVQELQLDWARQWYDESFDMPDLINLVVNGETYKNVRKHHANKFIKNEKKRAETIQLIYDSCKSDESRMELEAVLAVARSRVRNLDEANEEDQQMC